MRRQFKKPIRVIGCIWTGSLFHRMSLSKAKIQPHMDTIPHDQEYDQVQLPNNWYCHLNLRIALANKNKNSVLWFDRQVSPYDTFVLEGLFSLLKIHPRWSDEQCTPLYWSQAIIFMLFGFRAIETFGQAGFGCDESLHSYFKHHQHGFRGYCQFNWLLADWRHET